MWLESKVENSHLVPKFMMCRDLLLGYHGGELRHSNNSSVILITFCATICRYYYSSLYKDCRSYHVDTGTDHVMFLNLAKIQIL
jgi:hypothetical protein